MVYLMHATSDNKLLAKLPYAATFENFSQAFLARFVKPSDSAKARAELPYLKQTDSVEAFASHFRNVNSRISVDSPTDTITLATYFVCGLKTKLAKTFAVHCSLATMQELDSVSAAEEMEAQLNLAAKQDPPSLAALSHADGRNTPQRGGHGAARKPRGGTGGARGPYSWLGGSGSRAGRGNNGRGRTNQISDSRSAPAAPAQGANSLPLSDRSTNAVGKNASGGTFKAAVGCGHCHITGHSIHDCRKLKALLNMPKKQGVSFSSVAYFSAYPVHTADARLSSSSPAAHAGTDNVGLMSDILADIGTPMTCNAMPDPEAVNTGFALDPRGHVNALSRKGPKLMFNAELAVSGDHMAARALVPTGATHCYVSQKFIQKTTLPICQQHTWLSLANGTKAVSSGMAVLPRVLLSALSFPCLITSISFLVKTGVKHLIMGSV